MRQRLSILLSITLALALATLATLGMAHAAGLNDTGITDCWDDTGVAGSSVAADSGTHPRQDCRYGRDAAAKAGVLPKAGGGNAGFDFTKIANNGSALPASATLGSGASDWACTRDNVTGLIWEVKTNSDLRSQSHSYTWYNSNPVNNGGSAGTAAGGSCATSARCDTEKFTADVNAIGLCGAADWRMPTRKELVSIVDYGRFNPSIDLTYFPNTNTLVPNVWSASADAYYSGRAWFVNFHGGDANTAHYKYDNLPVRLVRAGQ